MALNRTKNYAYDCAYFSPVITLGMNIKSNQKVHHQVILKTQYNSVNKYNYRFYADNGSGKNSGFETLDDETLSYKIPNFISIEPIYVLLINSDFFTFKIHSGLNFVEPTYKHSYTWTKVDYGGKHEMKRISSHPKSMGINFGFGFIFRINTKHRKEST